MTGSGPSPRGPDPVRRCFLVHVTSRSDNPRPHSTTDTVMLWFYLFPASPPNLRAARSEVLLDTIFGSVGTTRRRFILMDSGDYQTGPAALAFGRLGLLRVVRASGRLVRPAGPGHRLRRSAEIQPRASASGGSGACAASISITSSECRWAEAREMSRGPWRARRSRCGRRTSADPARPARSRSAPGSRAGMPGGVARPMPIGLLMTLSTATPTAPQGVALHDRFVHRIVRRTGAGPHTVSMARPARGQLISLPARAPEQAPVVRHERVCKAHDLETVAIADEPELPVIPHLAPAHPGSDLVHCSIGARLPAT